MPDNRGHFSSARKAALAVLQRIEQTDAYADIAINSWFAKTPLSQRDKDFTNELVRGTIRLKKRLDWIAKAYLHNPGKQISNRAKWILRLAFYQLTELKSMPAYAILHQSVEMAKYYEGKSLASLINGVLRNYVRNPGKVIFPPVERDPVRSIALQTSHPEWMVEKWINDFGIEQTFSLCLANNRKPVLHCRRNPLKISKRDLEESFKANDIVFESHFLPNFYILSSFKAIQPYLTDGLLSIQDASAGITGFILAPQKKQLIVDVCSAPGGKSTHMAELAQNKAGIVANDVHRSRISLVSRACERLGLHSIQPLVSDARELPLSKADAVLVDAPCSGHGVLAKRADLRWKRQKDDIKALSRLQQHILETASGLVLKGGTLVYSTCTIETEENEGVVQRFLQKHTHFRVIKPEQAFLKSVTSDRGFIKTLQHLHAMDGSFCVKMVKV